MIELAFAIDINAVSADATLLASIAIILGTIFVVIEMRDNKRLVEASFKQANTAALQLKQNHELATVDLITKMYDFANSLEVQRSWFTVVNSKISSYQEFEEAPQGRPARVPTDRLALRVRRPPGGEGIRARGARRRYVRH